VLFPPIRIALLEIGVAVCSFDKRGVGESSGSCLTAGIEAQAADLVAGLAAARSVLGDVPTGLFGHSQGGWVVLEASTVANPDFIITNSGPAVSPREQETYSTEQTLRKRGWDDETVRAGFASFRTVMDLLELPYDIGWLKASALPLIDELTAVGAFIPRDPELWSFASRIIDYDPVPALRALDVPLLALLGEEDDVVPVQRSADVFHTTVPPDLLHLRVVSGGDHRLQKNGEFVDGYLDALTQFVSARLRN
jgi:pimeloyl-ACP methyl ester carboxylesterase